jgi:hypothetical protein
MILMSGLRVPQVGDQLAAVRTTIDRPHERFLRHMAVPCANQAANP